MEVSSLRVDGLQALSRDDYLIEFVARGYSDDADLIVPSVYISRYTDFWPQCMPPHHLKVVIGHGKISWMLVRITLKMSSMPS